MKWMRPVEHIDFKALQIRVRGKVEANGHAGLTTLIASEYTLLQFTGLKDKNGKEIYEGDIVSCTEKVDEGGGWSSKQKIPRGKVYFDADWGVKIDDIYTKHNLTSRMWRDFYNVEVIGNIYENPDLLT
jgi:uncharacterized phage protein (TIGR01671 family)